MRPSSKRSAAEPRPRWVTLYPLFDEWGPKGEPSRALMIKRSGTVFLYAETLPKVAHRARRTGLRARAEADLRSPGEPGWARFTGLLVSAEVLAQTQEHCVSLPEGPWWEWKS
jgi:hypothetical protein